MEVSNSEAIFRVCQKLVEREVVYCASELVSHLAKCPDAFRDSPYHYDEVLDLCVRRGTPEDALEQCGYEVLKAHDYFVINGKQYDFLEEACDDLGIDLSEYNSEVYEHWIVSRFLAGKLRSHGETVGELFGLTIWGRCTTGQAICMDGVINEIAFDMEILPGQRHAWE